MVEHDTLLVHRVRDLDAREHTNDAVITTAAHHGIAVGAGHQGAGRRVAALTPPHQVAAGVQRDLQARGLELLAQPDAALQEQIGECAARPGLAWQRHGGQVLRALPQPGLV